MGLLGNAKWLALSQIIKVICQLLSLTVLVRLISPSEYGLMAMAGVIVTLGFLFRDMGTSAALIQKKDLNDDLKNAVFWLNLITGITLSLLIIIFSPFVAKYFNEPDLISILTLLSFTFPITCFSSSHLALMERQSRFKTVALIESTSSLIATTLAIIAAYKNAGVYSLVIQSLANALISTLLIFRYSNWKPSIHGYLYLSEIKHIFMFSGNLITFNFVNYFSRNSDRYIIGRFMSSSTLGAYDLAYKIMLFPLQTLTFVISRSMLPILSVYQNDTVKFNEVFLNSLVMITLISFPLMVGLMSLRDVFVYLVFGPKWHAITGILLWLAPTGILQSINSTTGAVLTAKGKTHLLLYTGFMSAIIYVSSFILSSHLDIVSFSRNYFYANVVAVGLNLIMLCFFIKMKIFIFIRSLLPATIASLAMWAALNILKQNFNHGWFDLMFLSFSGLLVYLFVYVFVPGNFILSHFRRKS